MTIGRQCILCQSIPSLIWRTDFRGKCRNLRHDPLTGPRRGSGRRANLLSAEGASSGRDLFARRWKRRRRHDGADACAPCLACAYGRGRNSKFVMTTSCGDCGGGFRPLLPPRKLPIQKLIWNRSQFVDGMNAFSSAGVAVIKSAGVLSIGPLHGKDAGVLDDKLSNVTVPAYLRKATGCAGPRHRMTSVTVLLFPTSYRKTLLGLLSHSCVANCELPGSLPNLEISARSISRLGF
jgi:hypothetical protein